MWALSPSTEAHENLQSQAVRMQGGCVQRVLGKAGQVGDRNVHKTATDLPSPRTAQCSRRESNKRSSTQGSWPRELIDWSARWQILRPTLREVRQGGLSRLWGSSKAMMSPQRLMKWKSSATKAQEADFNTHGAGSQQETHSQWLLGSEISPYETTHSLCGLIAPRVDHLTQPSVNKCRVKGAKG